MTIKICQWNATSVVNKKNMLSQFLYSNNITVIAIQESFLKPHINFQIKDYNIIRKDRPTSTHGGGVCILLHSSLKYEIINLTVGNDPIEAVGCRFQVKNKSIVLANIYIPPNASFNKSNLQKVLDNCYLKPSESIIFCGDFNGHHSDFGSHKTDRKGSEIINFINDNNLTYLNDGSPTFFHANGSSPLDLTIVNPSLALDATWSSFNEQLTSNHCVVMTTLNYQIIKQKRRFIVPSPLDSEILNNKLQHFFLSNTYKELKTHDKIKEFNQFFFEEFKKITPKRKNIKSNPWWNENSRTRQTTTS